MPVRRGVLVSKLLSPAMITVLRAAAASKYGTVSPGSLHGSRQTIDALERRGMLKAVWRHGFRQYGITDAGRAALA